MSYLPLELTILILILLATALAGILILLYFHESGKRKKVELEGQEFLESIGEKGWETLNQSFKKSQAILGQAELEGIRVAAESKLEITRFTEDFAKQLAQSLNESKQTIAVAQAGLLQFMQELQKRSATFEATTQQAGQNRINKLFEGLEQRLSDFLIQTEQQTTSSIELELRSTRQLIETYKNQQFALIDENIIAMMEQTLNVVLGKKLTLKDQLDLVYEALEKAKVEKFIV